MVDQNRTQLIMFMAHLEENWGNLNALFYDLSVTDGWGEKHGADWTFADLPYHLAYCNEEIFIRGLTSGADLPEKEQTLLPSPDAINAWNARKFAERPAGQTAEQSVAQWKETCDDIRRLASGLNDADLEKPFWMPLLTGWSTTREGFEFTRAHDWAEFIQLRIHMGRQVPVPSAEVTRAYLVRILSFYTVFLDREAAGDRTFTAVMEFTNPGVGSFTLSVVEGAVAVKHGPASDADLVMTQSVESFVKTLSGMHNPAEAMKTGEIRVNDFEALAVFGQLFPMG